MAARLMRQFRTLLLLCSVALHSTSEPQVHLLGSALRTEDVLQAALTAHHKASVRAASSVQEGSAISMQQDAIACPG